MPDTHRTHLEDALARRIRDAFYDLDETALRGIFLDELRPVIEPWVPPGELDTVRLAIARGIARASVVYADVARRVVVEGNGS